MAKLPDKELLRPEEVAKYYSVKLKTVYRWIDSGKLEGTKIAGRALRINRNALKTLEKSTII
jgi:excisionase family DNA binding protein